MHGDYADGGSRQGDDPSSSKLPGYIDGKLKESFWQYNTIVQIQFKYNTLNILRLLLLSSIDSFCRLPLLRVEQQ